MSETKLLPCPFCGGKAEINIFLGNYCVTCTECMGAIFPSRGMTKEEAIEAWNTRKPMERIVERLEEAIDHVNEAAMTAGEADFYPLGKESGLMDAIKIAKEEGGL